jgi:SP family arabinose:H+ symporter-like MFS transporter
VNSASRVFLVGATAALGGLLFGFDVGIITGAGPFLEAKFHLSDLALGWAYSSLLFGCVIGSTIAGWIADRFGRRTPLQGVAILFAASSIAAALAPSFLFFIVARVLGGLAVGAESALTPMYVAEVSPRRLRGRMGTLYQLAIVTGIVCSYCVNFGFRHLGDWNWRYMFLTGALPAVVFWFMLWRIPESPRYLVLRGRLSEAESILSGWLIPAEARAEIAEIKASFQGAVVGWRELWRPEFRPNLKIGFILALLVQFSGINTVIDYAPKILMSAGWNIDTALFSTFGIGLTNFLFTFVSFGVIDRFGRKPLYITGSLGMTAALAALSVAAAMDRFSGGLVFALVIAFIAFFASCIGPVFWTLLPEIYPNRIRGEAIAIPVITQWIANAVVVLYFPKAFSHAGKAGTFGFLAVVSLAQAWFTWKAVPETKGKSLEEIEHSMSGVGKRRGTSQSGTGSP